MVAATNQPPGTSQFITAFNIILWCSILGNNSGLCIYYCGFFKNTFFFFALEIHYHALQFPNPSNPNCHLWLPHAEHFIPHKLFCRTYACNEHDSVPEDYSRPQMNKKDAPIRQKGHLLDILWAWWRMTHNSNKILHLCRTLEHFGKGCLSIPGSDGTLWILRFPVVASHLIISTQARDLDRFQIFSLQCLDSNRC